MSTAGIRFFEESSHRLKQKRQLQRWIAETIDGQGFQLEALNVVLVDDKRIALLNEEHLKHKGPTDVITFQYNDKAGPIDGEVYISMETVAVNAKRFRVSLEEELHRVMIHGVLHLCGYSDKTVAAKEAMKKMEESALSVLRSRVA